jgi:Ca2+-binding EF-hand superfamily protein
LSSALPPPDIKNRIVDKPLSNEVHYDKDTQEHNSDYDHEAFLGKDDTREFDQLTPDESKSKLGIIYDKIDKNGDGVVSEGELTEWIKYVQTRYVRVDTDRQWKEQNPDNNATLTWDAYKQRIYGFVQEDDEEKEVDMGGGGYNYRLMLQRDKRRWARADVDGDSELTKEEFSYFLHPEETDHMKDIIIDETLEDIDKDKDGKVSLEEYIGDMWPNSLKESEGEEEPDWVKSEREQFSKYRDQDHDGFMDREEIRHWITPPDYDHTVAEAKHLIYESDVDKDGSLTKQEVLDKYEVFVGSQATDFGEALRKHDEF